MAVASLPGSHFILVKPNITFANLKTLFYRPSITNNFNHLLMGGAHRCKDEDISSIRSFLPSFHVLSNHQIVAPSSNFSTFKRYNSPIVQPRSFAPSTCTQALSVIWC